MAGRPCTVCAAPDRRAIETALLSGSVPLMQIARDHGLSAQALLRHKESHIPRTLQAAAQVARQQDAEEHGASVMDEIKKLGRQAQGMMARAYNSGDLRTANSFMETARRCLETQARMLGQIETGNTTVHIHQSVEFKAVVVNLVRALDRPEFADAKEAVLLALGSDMPADGD